MCVYEEAHALSRLFTDIGFRTLISTAFAPMMQLQSLFGEPIAANVGSPALWTLLFGVPAAPLLPTMLFLSYPSRLSASLMVVKEVN